MVDLDLSLAIQAEGVRIDRYRQPTHNLLLTMSTYNDPQIFRQMNELIAGLEPYIDKRRDRYVSSRLLGTDLSRKLIIPKGTESKYMKFHSYIPNLTLISS
jgi:hypothetical protein